MKINKKYFEEKINKSILKKLISMTICTTIGASTVGIVETFANEKVDIYKAIMKTFGEYEKELKDIEESNYLVNTYKKIGDCNTEIEFIYEDDYWEMDTSLNIANDKENEIYYISGSYNDDYENIESSIFITNDKNYLSVNEISYSFDTKQALYNFINWYIGEEYLGYNYYEEDKYYEYLIGFDYNYNTITSKGENIINSYDNKGEFISKILDIVNNSEIKVSNDTLMVNGQEREVTVSELEISLYDILYAYKYFAPENKEEIDLLLETEEIRETILFSIYEYNGFIVKYDLKTFENNEMINNISLVHNNTRNMLSEFEINIVNQWDEVKLVFENDLKNEDYMQIYAKTYNYGELVHDINFYIDYRKKSDNFIITSKYYDYYNVYEEYYHELFQLNETIDENKDIYETIDIYTLRIDEDSIKFIYIDDYLEELISVEYKILKEDINVPIGAPNLFDIEVEEFIDRITKFEIK